MEDDMFLRCLESNLLSDMALQGIEQIAKARTKACDCHVTLMWLPGCDCHVTAKLHIRPGCIAACIMGQVVYRARWHSKSGCIFPVAFKTGLHMRCYFHVTVM